MSDCTQTAPPTQGWRPNADGFYQCHEALAAADLPWSMKGVLMMLADHERRFPGRGLGLRSIGERVHLSALCVRLMIPKLVELGLLQVEAGAPGSAGVRNRPAVYRVVADVSALPSARASGCAPSAHRRPYQRASGCAPSARQDARITEDRKKANSKPGAAGDFGAAGRILEAAGLTGSGLRNVLSDRAITPALAAAAVQWAGRRRAANPAGMIVSALREHLPELQIEAAQIAASDRRATAGRREQLDLEHDKVEFRDLPAPRRDALLARARAELAKHNRRFTDAEIALMLKYPLDADPLVVAVAANLARQERQKSELVGVGGVGENSCSQ